MCCTAQSTVTGACCHHKKKDSKGKKGRENRTLIRYMCAVINIAELKKKKERKNTEQYINKKRT